MAVNVVNPNNPDFTCQAYKEMKVHWELPIALWGGTLAMREYGVTYLPMHPAETKKFYSARLNRTVLRNFYQKTIVNLVSKVFSKQIVIGDDVEADIVAMLENVDLGGRHLNVFARDVFEDACNKGLSHIMVDFPTSPVPEGTTPTLADERKAGNRPYAVHVKAEQVINWRSKLVNGEEILTLVVITEELPEEDGLFGEVITQQIRVLRPGSWELWRPVKGGWAIHLSGKTSLDVIPLVTIYTKRTHFMQAVPPLEDLAYTNLEHWQVRSDQRTALSYCSFPILAASGWNSEDDGEVTIGPNKMLTTKDPAGKFYYLESGGAHLAAGQEELENLENSMRLYGLQFEVPGSGDATATARSIDAAEGAAPLKRWAIGLGDGLEQMLMLFNKWLKRDPKKSGSLTVNQDIGISLKDAQEIELLYKARTSREISQETFLDELKRRGVLREDFDIKTEVSNTIDEATEMLKLEAKFSDNTGAANDE